MVQFIYSWNINFTTTNINAIDDWCRIVKKDNKKTTKKSGKKDYVCLWIYSFPQWKQSEQVATFSCVCYNILFIYYSFRCFIFFVLFSLNTTAKDIQAVSCVSDAYTKRCADTQAWHNPTDATFYQFSNNLFRFL